ncbi:MAG: GNAT family N-acetyltransferase [Nocardioides sp.]
MADHACPGAGHRPADPAIELVAVSFDHPDVPPLVVDVQAEYTGIYGGGDDTPIGEGEFDPPRGAFFVAYRSDDHQRRPIGMAGWRFRPDVDALGGVEPAEVKRMYVVPAERGNGLARHVLNRVESNARAAGADVMVLETGAPQRAAVGLYRSAGYVDIPHRFGHHADSPDARYLAKRLS